MRGKKRVKEFCLIIRSFYDTVFLIPSSASFENALYTFVEFIKMLEDCALLMSCIPFKL